MSNHKNSVLHSHHGHICRHFVKSHLILGDISHKLHQPTHTHPCGDSHLSCTQQWFLLEVCSAAEIRHRLPKDSWLKTLWMNSMFFFSHWTYVVSHSNRQIRCWSVRPQSSSDGVFLAVLCYWNLGEDKTNSYLVYFSVWWCTASHTAFTVHG